MCDAAPATGQSMTTTALRQGEGDPPWRQAPSLAGVSGRPSADASPAATGPAAPAGSRRRRLWALGSHAHCPVVGVCLPLPALRRLVGKVVGGEVLADDYELHCGVVADCKQRTRLAEALQRELDRRYAGVLRQGGRHKTTEALALWWREAQAGTDIAGALWATLSHPRCDPFLEEAVLRDVHMLQHQAGAAGRADLQRLHALLDENAVLARELAAAQQRATRAAREQGLKVEQLQAQAVQLRGDVLSRDTVIAQLRESHAALSQAVPGLKTRIELVRQRERQAERIHELERALLRQQQALERAERRAALAEPAPCASAAATPATADAAPGPDGSEPGDAPAFNDRAVLCVGGRPASVPVYRRLVEGTGGRFLHHDGGDEDSVIKLDATLAAADLVICQTGCVSHDAYWRVKDHCKRTGKPCVFVDNPSRSGLQRALRALGERPAARTVIELVAAMPAPAGTARS